MQMHSLKCWPVPFQAVFDGHKTYEIRDTSDRTYRVGDVLVLCEWSPETEEFSGRVVLRLVTYMTPGGDWGLPDNLAILAIKPVIA